MKLEQFARALLELEKRAADVDAASRMFLALAMALRVADAEAKKRARRDAGAAECSSREWADLCALALELVRYGEPLDDPLQDNEPLDGDPIGVDMEDDLDPFGAP
jgi:hypothetical protein